MRIEQRKHLRPIVVASSLRSMRAFLRIARPRLAILALLTSVLFTCSLAFQLAGGKPVAAWQWVGGVGMGPMMCGIFLPWVCLLRTWVEARFDRYAEIRGHRVHLGKIGYSFRLDLLIYCKIEHDPYFDGIYHLGFSFKTFRSGRPLYWLMMVEDLDEAEAFQRELERLAFEQP